MGRKSPSLLPASAISIALLGTTVSFASETDSAAANAQTTPSFASETGGGDSEDGSAAQLSFASETDNCWHQAASRYQLDPWLLYAIAEQESSLNPAAVNINKASAHRQASKDVGLMQINSQWLPVLNEYGITEEQLFDPCTSIHVGAWVLAQAIATNGYTWRAVGAYNAGNKTSPQQDQRRENYAKRVFARYERLAARLRN